MSAAPDPFKNSSFYRKVAYTNWHRQQSKQHILRSQLGFMDMTPSRPKSCLGCNNYHGVAYGYSRETRTVLICGIHPSGWPGDSSCPDWCGGV